MIREKRLGYLGLTEVELPNGGNPIMCSFCRYAEWQGWSCKERYAECHHPLMDRSWSFERMTEGLTADDGCGTDCWGFRPDVSIETAADIVGIWLQGLGVDSDTVPVLGRGRDNI